MNKEQVLLGVVIALVAGIYAMDGRYAPVAVPSTSPPSDVPSLPFLGDRSLSEEPRSERSMFTIKPEYEDPPLVELAPPPMPEVWIADPPFRPWVHPDAAVAFRHRLVDVEAEEDRNAAAGGDQDNAEGDGVEEPAPFEDESTQPRKPLELTTFDWVVVKGGLSTRSYGVIDLLPADAEKGRTKWEVLVDPDLDFTWTQIDSRTGKRLFTQARYRERVESLGFSDTIENLHEARLVQERSGGRRLDADTWRRVAAWIEEQSAANPRYSTLTGLEYAAQDLVQALRLNPDAVTVKELARVYSSSWRPDDALALYDWWLGRQGATKDPEFIALRARVLEDLGLREKAIEDYTTSLVTRPSGSVRLRLGNLLLASRKLPDARTAEEVFRRAVQDGERVPGTIGLARATLAQGRVKDAEGILNGMPSGDRDATWYNATGAVLAIQKRLPEASDHFEAAVTRGVAGDGTLAVSRTNAALAHARMAAAATDPRVRGDEVKKALSLCDEALKDDPLNYYWPLVVKGYALRVNGDRAGAVGALQEAIAAEPHEPYGRYLLGEFLLRDGRPEEARTQFLASANMASGFPDALAGVGRAGGGQPGEAREYLRRAVELDPGTPVWYLLAAQKTLVQSEVPEAQRQEDARRDIEELLSKQEHRNYALGHAYLGFIRYARGDAENAMGSWNTALRLIRPVKPGTPEEVLETWLKSSAERVNLWQGTKIWRDEFKRPDGNAVGNRWQESEGSGVKVTIADGAAQFGRGRHVTGQDPRLAMEWDVAAKIQKVFVEFNIQPNETCDSLVDFSVPSGKSVAVLAGLRRKENGEVLLRLKGDLRDREVKEYPLKDFKWPQDGRMVFGLVREGDEGGVRLLLNGEAVRDPRQEDGNGPLVINLTAFAKSRGGKFRVEMGTEASGGAEVFLRIEAVEVWLDVR